ncbi:PAQR family membrane homeostasis protein TrhA [Fuchsiella alkaliacetigena]|uniref:PAQR family membrane homeostasis protein TrhA n=1 Tax=Fuchsiella alkaliacetigena TaxID=957042 RepID=UPI00200A56EA|nr:hemolysin III family protein [Fuchsiella alkaliacetigena]MCK8825938.1 hemolysin III family protein [Fuchsiella alkaliacetigena]
MSTIKKEEKVSFYSHFIGFILAIIGAIYLIYIAEGFALKTISLIYGLSVILLFSASSLYHANKKHNEEISIWRKLDHIAIFIMIAGTYTPISFVYLSGYWKWSIIIIQWTLVLGGVFFKFFYLNAPRYLYTIIYLLMGWIGIVPITRFIRAMSSTELSLLFAGGISYTIGVAFYILKKPQFSSSFGFHEIFHFFILLGAFFNYLLVHTAVIQ